MVSRCFPGGYNVKLYISRGRLAWWLLAFLCCGKYACLPICTNTNLCKNINNSHCNHQTDFMCSLLKQNQFSDHGFDDKHTIFPVGPWPSLFSPSLSPSVTVSVCLSVCLSLSLSLSLSLINLLSTNKSYTHIQKCAHCLTFRSVWHNSNYRNMVGK